MCGRYTLFAPPEELEARFDVRVPADLDYATYNAAPGQALPVVASDEPDVVRPMRWGLVPSWREEASRGLINARAKTVAEKPSFREAYERRRCLVPADGFYRRSRPSPSGLDPEAVHEWAEADGGTRPHRVARPDDEPFAMAGIWERWTPERTQTGLDEFGGGGEPAADPDPVETFAVVTTEPNDVVEPLHDRMAVVLDRGEEAAWLAGEDVPLDPYDGELRAYPVSPAVGDPSNDFPGLVDPV